MAGRNYSARVMKFRASVYGSDKITNGCKVLLLRLSDDMSGTAIVSIPRSKLAEEFNVRPATITEQITAAREAGFLTIVRRARPKVTAVYQGHEVRPGVPLQRYGNRDPSEVRPAVPLKKPQRYARTPSQEGIETALREPPEWLDSDDAAEEARSVS